MAPAHWCKGELTGVTRRPIRVRSNATEHACDWSGLRLEASQHFLWWCFNGISIISWFFFSFVCSYNILFTPTMLNTVMFMGSPGCSVAKSHANVYNSEFLNGFNVQSFTVFTPHDMNSKKSYQRCSKAMLHSFCNLSKCYLIKHRKRRELSFCIVTSLKENN